MHSKIVGLIGLVATFAPAVASAMPAAPLNGAAVQPTSAAVAPEAPSSAVGDALLRDGDAVTIEKAYYYRYYRYRYYRPYYRHYYYRPYYRRHFYFY